MQASGSRRVPRGICVSEMMASRNLRKASVIFRLGAALH
jgi:hypothetical protein